MPESFKESITKEIELYEAHMNRKGRMAYMAGQVKVYLEEMRLTRSQIAEKMGISEEQVYTLAARDRAGYFDFESE